MQILTFWNGACLIARMLRSQQLFCDMGYTNKHHGVIIYCKIVYEIIN
jgi:hypothetical protein